MSEGGVVNSFYYESNEDLVKISTLVDGKELSFRMLPLKAGNYSLAPFQQMAESHIYMKIQLFIVGFILFFTSLSAQHSCRL